MTSKDAITDLTDALKIFVQGAKTLNLGYFLGQRGIQNKGFAAITKAIKVIDTASTTGRDILLPLLDDKDECVRAVAASGLWQSHFDRAVSTLADVQDFGITDARGLAIGVLMTRGQLNPCGSDPRFPSLYGKEGNALDGAKAALRANLPPLGIRGRPRRDK